MMAQHCCGKPEERIVDVEQEHSRIESMLRRYSPLASVSSEVINLGHLRMPRQRNLWVSDAFERGSWARVGGERQAARTQLFWVRSQLALEPTLVNATAFSEDLRTRCSSGKGVA